MFKLTILITLLCFFLTVKINAQTEKINMGLVAPTACKAIAPFVLKLGFNPNTSAFSTSEKKYIGVVLIDYSSAKNIKRYQDTTWKNFGNMGPLAIDQLGNIFVAPIPIVNVLTNKKEDQNKIYKIDAATGKMALFLNLGAKPGANPNNAYGIVGLYYDCNKQNIYASSIYNSNETNENGIIYCININTKKVISTLNNTDAMGLGVAEFNSKPCLFFGHTRNHVVYYVYLNSKGIMEQVKNKAFSLVNLGPRGDDIAKKIKFSPQNQLIINSTTFYYNLTAPGEIQETVYTYVYQIATQKWVKTNEENKGLVVGY